MENKQGGTAGVFPVPVRSVSVRPHISESIRRHSIRDVSFCNYADSMRRIEFRRERKKKDESYIERRFIQRVSGTEERV